MNDSVVSPDTFDQLRDVVASEKRVLAVGNRTKPPLSACPDATLVSLRALSGITEYEPSEFTFTAHAGTPLAEIRDTLAAKCQYLPFDPMLVDAGATIAGSVAAGLSGPGRFRYGGIRDFLLGVRFISGDGNVINAGGKVVKNAAGFDIPKFLVGSMGRFGVMTELTFKVFPKPTVTRTLSVQCETHAVAFDRMAMAASSRWELDSIDYRPSEQRMLLRLAGPDGVNTSLSGEIRSTWGEDVSDLTSSDEFWRSVGELNWSTNANVAVKVPTTPRQFIELHHSFADDPNVKMHASVAANVAWVLLDASESISVLDGQLRSLEIPGLVVRGSCDQPRIGKWNSFEIESAIKAAMDPPGKFPAF